MDNNEDKCNIKDAWPTPVLKCTKAEVTEKCAILSFKQTIGAINTLPREFTIAISHEDIKKITNKAMDDLLRGEE